jgi:hypothetical protein
MAKKIALESFSGKSKVHAEKPAGHQPPLTGSIKLRQKSRMISIRDRVKSPSAITNLSDMP